MALLIPKLKDGGGGGGWETPWFYSRKNNWLFKAKYDSDKNEMNIWIVHNTETHIGIVHYIGDEKYFHYSDYKYPMFICPICKRKSTGFNFREMCDLFVSWYMKKADELGAKILININEDEIINDFMKECGGNK